MTADELWNKLIELQGRTITTSGRRYNRTQKPGLSFTFTVHGRAIIIDRKEKPISYASIRLALENAEAVQAAEGYVCGPKKLGVFGASYLYAIFVYLGIINDRKPEIEEQLTLFEEQDEAGREGREMARPKGSKNRTALTLDEQIEKLNQEILELETELRMKREQLDQLTEKVRTEKKAEIIETVQASGLPLQEVIDLLATMQQSEKDGGDS